MYGLKYSYDIHVAKNSSMVTAQDGMSVSFPGCIDVAISSKPFDSYELCEGELTHLLSILGTAESRLANKSYVIVTKVNPLFTAGVTDLMPLENTSEKVNPGEEWDRLTVLKAYVAESDMIKNSAELSYGILGQLKITQESVDKIANQNFLTLQ